MLRIDFWNLIVIWFLDFWNLFKIWLYLLGFFSKVPSYL